MKKVTLVLSISLGLIGFMYNYGEGVLKDYKQAVKWYTKSAKQNYSKAQLTMAGMNIYGFGTPKDFSKAKFWTRKAFENPESSSKIKNEAESFWNTFELWEY